MNRLPNRRMIHIPRQALLFSAGLILAAILAAPALADFLGPDRTVPELVTIRDPDKDVWTLINNDPPPGVLGVCLIIHTCDQHPGVVSYAPTCLWVEADGTLNPAESSSCSMAFKDELQQVTYPEATISAALQGCNPVDGWCTSDPVLHLTGSEPVAGKSITLIEGTRNGEGFACPGDMCDVPLLQGENDFTFWALSTWGDSSQMGTLSAKVDSQPPAIEVPDSWKIWEPLSLSVDDSGAGLESVSLTIDGGQYGVRKVQWAASVLPAEFIWDRYFGAIVAPIGEYEVTLTAKDLVGNTSVSHGEIQIPAPDLEPEALAATIELPPTAAPPTQAEEALAQGPLPEPTEMVLASVIDELDSGQVEQTVSVPQSLAEGIGVQPLWGAAAAAASYAATNLALSRRKKREEEKEQLRGEAARANAGRSLEKRLASIWKSVQPTITAIAVRQQAEREAAAIEEREAERLAAEQATVARWNAIGEFYEERKQAELRELGVLGSYYLQDERTLVDPGQIHAPRPMPPTSQVVLDTEPLDWLWRVADLTGGIRTANDFIPIQFVPTQLGYVGVRVGDQIPSGFKLAYRTNPVINIPGTRYLPSTLAGRQFWTLVRDSGGKLGIGLPLISSGLTNIVDYGWGEHREAGIVSSGFAASTMVDFLAATASGTFAAVAVGGASALVTTIAAAAGATFVAPAAVVVAVTAGLGFGIGLLLDAWKIGDQSALDILKGKVAAGIDSWAWMAGTTADLAGNALQSAASAANGWGTAAVETASNALQSGIETVDRAVTQAYEATSGAYEEAKANVLDAAANVQETVEDAVDQAADFISGLFGRKP